MAGIAPPSTKSLLVSRMAEAGAEAAASTAKARAKRRIFCSPFAMGALLSRAAALGKTAHLKGGTYELEGHRRRVWAHRHAFAQDRAGNAGFRALLPHGGGVHPSRPVGDVGGD